MLKETREPRPPVPPDSRTWAPGTGLDAPGELRLASVLNSAALGWGGGADTVMGERQGSDLPERRWERENRPQARAGVANRDGPSPPASMPGPLPSAEAVSPGAWFVWQRRCF